MTRSPDSKPSRIWFRRPLHRANRLLSQTRKSKNKLLSWHAPEVEVIGKGKVAKAETLEQTEILSGVAPTRCHFDRGYQGAAVPGVWIFRSGQKRGVNTRTLKRELKHRSAVASALQSGDLARRLSQ